MSAHGRSEALIPSAQREGSPMSAHGRSEALSPPWGDGAQSQGGTKSAHGRSEALIPSAQREGSPVNLPGGHDTAPRSSAARNAQ